jgi:hypothetical protein
LFAAIISGDLFTVAIKIAANKWHKYSNHCITKAASSSSRLGGLTNEMLQPFRAGDFQSKKRARMIY